MSMNEADTRYHLIDPVLRDKGYVSRDRITLETVLTPPPVEPSGPKGRRRKGPGRTDYLLCVQVGDAPKPMPVAVLEAKKEADDPLKGMQQARGYADTLRFDVKYVFSTNGHRYGEYDRFTELINGPFAFSDFPSHAELTARYGKDTGIDLTQPGSAMLFQADSVAWSQSRYYQDAAIRAAFEKILLDRQAGKPPRVLLTLATGAGKTIIATNLLWRLSQAGQLPKPALFLCDRDELREQAYTKLKAAFGDNARIVRTERGGNAAANARIHIATYQTLGLDDAEPGDGGFASFLTEHYGEDAFSVIIIDECHRSAWGRWSEVLRRNPNAIHIGLTATPRKLAESKHASAEDQEITANNLKYFGEPVYEYTLIQAQEDGYLAACEIVKRKASIDSATFTKKEILAAGVRDIKTGQLLTEADLTKDEYTGKDFDDELFIELRTPKMCEDLFQLLCQNGGPEQKVIIFCTREIHADRVAQHMKTCMCAGARSAATRRRTTTPSSAWAGRTTART
jgi:type I restriction enzyme R subunit